MTAHEIDRLLTIAAFALPRLAVLLLRRGFLAILLGTLSAWLVLDAAPDWMARFDAEYEPNSLANGLWTVFGWIPALVYSSLLWLGKRSLQKIGKKQT